MTPVRWIAVGASLVGASYAGGLLVGHALHYRYVTHTKES